MLVFRSCLIPTYQTKGQLHRYRSSGQADLCETYEMLTACGYLNRRLRLVSSSACV